MQNMTPPITSSKVEQLALAPSGQNLLYPLTEKIGAIIVDNFPALGKLAALRFIEWVQQNPGGVVSLPTGKTPEHFIKWVKHFLCQWENLAVQKELEEGGVDPAVKPDMKSLHFVQIDEFYPIHPQQHNSFNYYITNFYLHGFGLTRRKPCSSIARKLVCRRRWAWKRFGRKISLISHCGIATAKTQRSNCRNGCWRISISGVRSTRRKFAPSAELDSFSAASARMGTSASIVNAFVSQKDASFPSYEHDGPFSEQYHILKTCLGHEFFNEHPSPLIRATRGLVFLKSLTLPQFYERSRALKRSTENL
jgi:hypothetical protein